MSSAISIQNVGKKYILAHQQREKYSALRDVITNKFKMLGKSSKSKQKEEFWALDDINLDIKQGDRVGIIGRNGAGKSTLLKILSRITEPTTGRININGRVASLLEVGTGFHPELTGRENIYLNGAILGMTRTEIKKKFDEIVEFAEVEKFLDTPVKRYSSGMYVRLAFAVAAHLEPEILIVDEVLAVGDMQFQKKCLSKMENTSSKEGRTVLFVSHQMDAIRTLCAQCIWLSKGKIEKTGLTSEVVSVYEQASLQEYTSSDGLFTRAIKSRSCDHWISSVELLHPVKGRTVFYEFNDIVTLKIKVDREKNTHQNGGYLVYRIWDESGHWVSSNETTSHGFVMGEDEYIYCSIGPMPLYVQKYFIEIGYGITGAGRLDTWEGEIFFEITSCDPYKSGKGFDKRSGVAYIPTHWYDRRNS